MAPRTAVLAPPSTGIPGLDNAIVMSGFRIEFDPQYPLVDVRGHLQHRHSPITDKKAVRRYTAMFKAGSSPPACGITRDGLAVWGNHRLEAAKQAGWQHIPAIVFDVDGIGADETVTDQLLALAVEENAPHGVPYNNQDRIDRAKSLLNLGYTSRSIQAKLGLTAAQVSGLRREVDSEMRLGSLGIHLPQGTHRSVKQALGGPAARALNDDPFKALVNLTNDAGLTSKDVNSHALAAKAAGSDAAALAHLDKVRSDLREAIASKAVTGTAVRPTPVGKLRGALRQVISLCDATLNPNAYRDHTNGVTETATMLDEAIACLAGIRAVQVLDEDDGEE